MFTDRIRVNVRTFGLLDSFLAEVHIQSEFLYKLRVNPPLIRFCPSDKTLRSCSS